MARGGFAEQNDLIFAVNMKTILAYAGRFVLLLAALLRFAPWLLRVGVP